jgi:hypothetical protein
MVDIVRGGKKNESLSFDDIVIGLKITREAFRTVREDDFGAGGRVFANACDIFRNAGYRNERLSHRLMLVIGVKATVGTNRPPRDKL